MHRRYLAEECFVVVAPAFPLTNNDVEGGFANAGPLVDPDRIGMIGHSLGGLMTLVPPSVSTAIRGSLRPW
jgi:hypothetical protein